MVWLVALTGCAWLTEVREQRIPVREREPEPAPVFARGGDGIPDRAMPAEPVPEWNPVRVPVEPPEPEEPFRFETAWGEPIKEPIPKRWSDPFPDYPSARDLDMTEEERRRLIREGGLEPNTWR